MTELNESLKRVMQKMELDNEVPESIIGARRIDKNGKEEADQRWDT